MGAVSDPNHTDRAAFRRYAVYFTPPPGPLADFGTNWLGWDLVNGCEPQGDIPETWPFDRDKLTRRPRKYGFHATLKPPFALKPGRDSATLQEAAREVASAQPSVRLEGLQVARIGSFLALVPVGDTGPIRALAASVIRELDCFRAAPSESELARRRKAKLTQSQEALLTRWGYPYVMEEFRFHMTLTGPLRGTDQETVQMMLAARLEQWGDAPLLIHDLTLVGEDQSGHFHEIARLPLADMTG